MRKVTEIKKMKMALIAAKDSQANYVPLKNNTQGLILVFKTLTEFLLDKTPYDFLILEQRAIENEIDIKDLKDKIALNRIFLILDAVRADMTNSYLKQGIRDVFTLPINFTELASKLKHTVETQNVILDDYQLGLSHTESCILSILRDAGPQGATKQSIQKKIWREEKRGSTTVNTHICNIRRKFEEKGKSIKIIWREGRWFLTE